MKSRSLVEVKLCRRLRWILFFKLKFISRGLDPTRAVHSKINLVEHVCMLVEGYIGKLWEIKKLFTNLLID